MGLKNIHDRKEFKREFHKLYEFGGDKGGLSATGGFANTETTPGDLLKTLTNGLFRGISWLWRKSKEYFVINKLSAQLVNELMRGVILWCFDNSINIGTGEQAAEAAEGATEGTETTTETGEADMNAAKKSAEEAAAEEVGKTEVATPTAPEVPGQEPKKHEWYPTLAQRIRLVKTKAEFNKIKPEVESRLKNDKLAVGKLKSEIQMRQNQKDTKKLAKDKKALDDMILAKDKEMKLIQKYDVELKQELELKAKQLGVTLSMDKASEFEPIKKDLPKFNPEAPSPELLKNLGIVVDPSKITVPVDFEKVKKDTAKFLQDNIANYDKMSDDQKQKMKTIYMNYKIIKNISNRLQPKNESFDFDDEMLNEVTAKIKTDEPRAGQVSVGKSVTQKLGLAGVSVSDILTKRDREKYKDKHADELKLDIQSVNLAAIEKVIATIENSNEKVKDEVSEYVNPYNLKMIQLSADKLMIPQTTKEGGTIDNSKLKIKWNKEVARVNAGFTNLMRITPNVDISKDDYKSDLNNNPKVTKKTDGNAKKTEIDMKIAGAQEELPLDLSSRSLITISSLADRYGIFDFTYKGEVYMVTFAPVTDFKGLFRITSCFTSAKGGAITENSDFTKIFMDGMSIAPDKRNLYFLMKEKQVFPKKDFKNAKIFLLNEANVAVAGGSKVTPFIKKRDGKYIEVNDSLDFTNLSPFTHDLVLYSVDIFKKDGSLNSSWKSALHYYDTTGLKNTQFGSGQFPLFFGNVSTDDKILNNIKKIQGYLK